RAADGIQLQSPFRNSQTIQQSRQHLQQLRIARRRLAPGRRRANDLRADLIKLPVASLLRPLPPELRANVIELVEAAVPKLVLDVSANHASSIFRAKRQRLSFITLSASSVFPRVHLFRNDVRLFAYPTRKQLRRLEDRRANFLEVVSAKHFAHHSL